MALAAGDQYMWSNANILQKLHCLLYQVSNCDPIKFLAYGFMSYICTCA